MTCKQLGEKGPLLAERWKDGATIIIIIIIIILLKTNTGGEARRKGLVRILQFL
jgi:hypothetical protein